MPWRTINGRKVWIEPKSGSPSDDPRDPRNETTSSPYDDEYNRKRMMDYARKKSDAFNKRKQQTKAQKKQARLDKVIHLDMGDARWFLIKVTPALVQLDPTLTSVYTGYKVGKYGYCFLKLVNEDYKTSRDFEESLKTVAKQEVEKKITSKFKSLPLENGSQYAANRVWTFCKETYSDGHMDPKWDKFGESALTKSFEEVVGVFL